MQEQDNIVQERSGVSPPVSQTQERHSHEGVDVGYTLVSHSSVPPVVELKVAGGTSAARFFPCGKKVLTWGSGSAQIWDTETGKELHRLEGIRNPVLSPNGKKIVNRTQNTVSVGTGFASRIENTIFHIWDTETGAELPRLEVTPDANNANRSFETNFHFSPDGEKFLTVTAIYRPLSDDWRSRGFENAILRIWDAESREELHRFEGHITPHNVRFSPDGKIIAALSWCQSEFYIWKFESGKEAQRLRNFRGFSPDGKQIVIRGEDAIYLLDAESGEELHKFDGRFTGFAPLHGFSPDGKKIVTQSEDGTCIWDIESGKMLLKLEGEPPFHAFSSDGKKIVTNDEGRIYIWDSESGKKLQRLEANAAGVVFIVEFSHDERRIVTVTRDRTIDDHLERTVRIWDAETGNELRRLDHSLGHLLDEVFFSRDGKKIVMGRRNEQFQVFDVESGEELELPAVVSVGQLELWLGWALTGFCPNRKKVIIGDRGGYNSIYILDLVNLETQIAYVKAKREAGLIDAERKRLAVFTNAINITQALNSSNLTTLHDFIRFGNADLKRIINEGDEFDRLDAAPKIRAAREEIAQKTFLGEYGYATSNVTAEVDTSSFTMAIATGFGTASVGEVIFPIPGVSGREGGSNPTDIALFVSGNTDAIRELVRGSDNYRVRVWFTNLRLERERPVADVLRIEIVKVE